MSIKSMLKSFYYKKIKKWNDAQIRINHLRRSGMTIGENTHIFSDYLETPEPYLISIGDNVMISTGVRFITHDVSPFVYGNDRVAYYGRVTIGNSCFVGMGSIILPGVKLADHCIVASGSVVTKSFTVPGSVVAGNPARLICTIDELKNKNKKYELETWGMDFQKKKEFLLANEKNFKGYIETL